MIKRRGIETNDIFYTRVIVTQRTFVQKIHNFLPRVVYSMENERWLTKYCHDKV